VIQTLLLENFKENRKGKRQLIFHCPLTASVGYCSLWALVSRLLCAIFGHESGRFEKSIVDLKGLRLGYLFGSVLWLPL
jgi:cytochrome b